MKTLLVATILLVNFIGAGAAFAQDDQTQVQQRQIQNAAINQLQARHHKQHHKLFVIKNATVAGELYNIVFPAEKQTEISSAPAIVAQN